MTLNNCGTKNETPTDVILGQIGTIDEAIQNLQASLNALTSEINPDATTWRDVSKFAHVEDIAREVIARYEATQSAIHADRFWRPAVGNPNFVKSQRP